MRKAVRLGHPLKSALTTEAVVASGAAEVVALSSAMTTEAPLGATEEAFRTEEEAVVEEATTEEVSSHTSGFRVRIGLCDCLFSQ